MNFEEPDVVAMAQPDYGKELAAALNTFYYKLGGGSGKSPDPRNDKGSIILLVLICWIVVVAIEG